MVRKRTIISLLISLILLVSAQQAMPETDLCSDFVTKKEYDMAIEECTKLIQSGKMDDSAYFNRGRAYLNKEQYDLAIADDTKAIELNPKSDKAYYDRGFTYYKKGLYDLSIADYTKTIELNPGLDGAFFERGIAYYKKGLYDLAITDYTKAIELNPKNDNAYFDRGLSYYYGKGQYDSAIADYTKAIELNPGLDGAFLERGIVYYKKGQYDLAITDYTKAIELNPKKDSAYFDRGLSYYYGKGQYDSAIADFSKAIELNPKLAVSEDAEKYSARGKAAFDMAKSDEDYAAAIAEFKKAVDAAPWRAQGYYNLGLAQEKAGQIDDAMKNFKFYLLAAPTAKDTQAVKNRIYGLEYKVEQKGKAHSMTDECDRLVKAGRNEEGIAACKEAIRLDPKYDLAHYNLGVALRDRFGVARRQEACPEAIPEFEEAIRLGFHLNAYINAGLCYSWLKDYRKAISIIEEGMRKFPYDDMKFAYLQLAYPYDMLGEYEKALNYYEKAKELGADDPVLDGNINNMRRKLGR